MLLRSLVQECLPEIFGHLNKAYRCISGRMSAHQVEERVLTLLDAWSKWSILSPVFLWGLEAIFRMTDSDWQNMQLPMSSDEVCPADEELEWERLKRRAKISGVSEIFWVSPEAQGHPQPGPLQDVVAEPVQMSALQLYRTLNHVNEFVKTKTITEESAYTPYSVFADGDAQDGTAVQVVNTVDDIDGVPMGENPDDIDGVPLDNDIDGVPIPCDDIDGVPIPCDDIDGVPIPYDDIDGAPFQGADHTGSNDCVENIDRQLAEYRLALESYIEDSSGIDDIVSARREQLLQSRSMMGSDGIEVGTKRGRSDSSDFTGDNQVTKRSNCDQSPDS